MTKKKEGAMLTIDADNAFLASLDVAAYREAHAKAITAYYAFVAALLDSAEKMAALPVRDVSRQEAKRLMWEPGFWPTCDYGRVQPLDGEIGVLIPLFGKIERVRATT